MQWRYQSNCSFHLCRILSFSFPFRDLLRFKNLEKSWKCQYPEIQQMACDGTFYGLNSQIRYLSGCLLPKLAFTVWAVEPGDSSEHLRNNLLYLPFVQSFHSLEPKSILQPHSPSNWVKLLPLLHQRVYALGHSTGLLLHLEQYRNLQETFVFWKSNGYLDTNDTGWSSILDSSALYLRSSHWYLPFWTHGRDVSDLLYFRHPDFNI